MTTDDSGSRTRLANSLADTISGQDLGDARAYFDRQLALQRKKLVSLSDRDDPLLRTEIELEIARAQLGLQHSADAWQTAFKLLPLFIEQQQFEQAVETAELLYLCDQPQSIKALAHACWLAISYPVDPALSTDVLGYIVEETPDDSDGAAVAAMVAHYLVELRADEEKKHSLGFLTKQVIAKVARRHRGIEDEESIKIWIEIHQLNDLDELFVRMAKIIDAMVEDQDWWIDRDALRANLPVN